MPAPSPLPSRAAVTPLMKLNSMSATAPTAKRMAMTAGAAERLSPAVWCGVSDMVRSLEARVA